MAYRIVTDTSANLPTPWLEEHGVPVIPFIYIENGVEKTCMDTEAFDGHAFYEGMRHGSKPTTSQINPQMYEDTLGPILEAGEDVMFISMSSGISGSFHSSEMAAEELRERFPERTIYTIDTRGASLGEGIPVMKAVEMKEAGASIDEVYEAITKMCVRMCQVFMVDDLMNLRRTGRLSNAAAIVGTVLRIKPLLKGNELGQIVNTDIIRTRKKALTALADKYGRWVVNAKDQIVGIAHADCLKDAEFLASMLREKAEPKEILIVGYEPVTGCHVGPDTVALFFESEEGVRSRN
ncbi:MAG: DegV family protein [Lachnospiraceae bacterium]|nr:DegV family protein [Lachnospiraceae bacterium]MBQ9562415.1 DegV family protein [Lachnospiraceae bacterium]MBQ9593629.1 DegV family protein [Lachnospiraceae bacterium]MBR0153953.1 DegV family protein [Lachnospiraceae bacterium]